MTRISGMENKESQAAWEALVLHPLNCLDGGGRRQARSVMVAPRPD